MKLAETCHRCSLSRLGRTQVVWGQGPESSPVVFIGEAPGQVEDSTGEPFATHYKAKAGMELNKLLRDIGLHREQVYVTNCVKCHPPDNRDPVADEVECCSMWLHMELDRLYPRVIVTVGRVSTRLVLGDVDMEQVHGIPYQVSWETLTGGDMRRRDTDTVTVIPVYHPAAGLHRPDLMMQVQADFSVVGQVLRGARRDCHVEDQFPRPQYSEICRYDPAIMALELGVVMDTGLVAVDTEWARGKPWCMSYSHTPGTAAMIPAEQTECLQDVAEVLADPSVTTVLHNALYDLPVLAQMGVIPVNPVDTMVMAYLLQSEPQGLKPLAYRYCGMAMADYMDMVHDATHRNAMGYLALVVGMSWPDPEPELVWENEIPRVRQSRNIGSLVARILSDASFKEDVNVWERWHNIDREAGRGEVERILGEMLPGDLSDVARDDAIHYACRDADATLRLYPHLWERIQEDGLADTFHRDMRALPMVADMMRVGIGIDKAHFRDLSRYLEMRRDAVLSEEIIQPLLSMGVDLPHFNPASPLQVARVLYDKPGGGLGLSKHSKKLDTGNETLARLCGLGQVVGQVPVNVIRGIKNWRSYAKLKGTYSDPMPDLADLDGRVHSTFRITRTSTGRLSSSKPNILAVPVRSSEGRLIRDGFVAGEGNVMLSCDYSQIELRVLAHMSQDPSMLHAFRTGVDIHTLTASRIWGVPVDQVDENTQRRPSKQVNFGIAYSIGPDALQGALISAGLVESDWPLDRCEELIQTWFGIYPGAKEYLSGVKSHAMRHGWVADMFGRRRWIPHAQSPNKQLKEEALRQAGNAPIQSGAGGIMKQSMGDLVPVYQEWLSQGVVVNPLIQIHDDLLFEIQENMLGILVEQIRWVMEHAVKLSIPTPVDPKVGKRWGSMVKYKG